MQVSMECLKEEDVYLFLLQKKDTQTYNILLNNTPERIINEKGIFAKAFPIKKS